MMYSMLCFTCISAVSPTKPHIIAILADDYGWADANWHRPASAQEPDLTPTLDGLVKTGVEMDRHYVFK